MPFIGMLAELMMEHDAAERSLVVRTHMKRVLLDSDNSPLWRYGSRCGCEVMDVIGEEWR